MDKLKSLAQRFFLPDPLIFWAYALPMLYWAYLILTTNFVLVFDSVGYHDLAALFADGRWKEYFTTGPNREPLYVLIVALAMLTGKVLSLSYIYPLKIFSFGLLAATIAIIQKILKALQVSLLVEAVAVFYTGFSPILVNSALCMFSEVATFPILVGAVLAGIHYQRSLAQLEKSSLFPGIMLGLCLLGYAFVKGMGEIMVPAFMMWLLYYAWRCSGTGLGIFLRQNKSRILALLLAFYLPLLGFKSLNLAFNGHFDLTNRSEEALYGTFTLRATTPLNLHNSLVLLSTSAVSHSECTRFFPHEACAHWERSYDTMMVNFQAPLFKQHLPVEEINRITRQAILKAAWGHPVNQLVYAVEEAFKMFFWETTQGAFVVYPPWLINVFNTPAVVLVSTLGAAAVCLVGFFAAFFYRKHAPVAIALALTICLCLVFGFSNIISRYTIIAGPLMVLINASVLGLFCRMPRR